MTKSFLGPRLRRLREERGMTQLAIAKTLGVSPSYYNQLENNQRPLTVPLLLKISQAFGVDAQFFAEDDEGRLLADMRESLSLSAPETVVSATELREFARNHPTLAQALVVVHGRQRAASERAD
ncbi:MAG: helix-turn-helix transcriptional regulator, partial [Polyangiales bacterium]